MPVLFGRATDHPRQKRRSLREITGAALFSDPDMPMLDAEEDEAPLTDLVVRDRSPRLIEETVH